MVQQKSNKLSVEFRNIANIHFNQKMFTTAVIEYNRALNYAVSKENLSFAYANRSAVCLELKKYEQCLQNIQWALENEYPAVKVPKLLERKAKCEELMLNDKIKEEKESLINNFFQLSYPANPKIPFIIDGLEMRTTKKIGGIFTTRDLKPGDIISIEDAILNCMGIGTEYERCCNCLKVKIFDLIPCSKTALLMFCSVKCRDEVYKTFTPENFDCLLIDFDNYEKLFTKFLCIFEHAFGGRENFMKFIKGNNIQKWKKTIFDYDFSNPNDPDNKMNALKSILSYRVYIDYKEQRKMVSKAAKITSKGDGALQDFLEHLGVAWESHAFCSVMTRVTNSSSNDSLPMHNITHENRSQLLELYSFSPLINYSCFPNVIYITTGSGAHATYVTRPIKAGEELFRAPIDLDVLRQPAKMRRKRFRTHSLFYCQCYYCEKDLTVFSLPTTGINFPIKIKPIDPEISKNIAQLKEYFKEIEVHEEKARGSIESYVLCRASYHLMEKLSIESMML